MSVAIQSGQCADACSGRGLVLGIEDPYMPEHIINDEQASWSQFFDNDRQRVGVIFLVDVNEDQVKGTGGLM